MYSCLHRITSAPITSEHHVDRPFIFCFSHHNLMSCSYNITYLGSFLHGTHGTDDALTFSAVSVMRTTIHSCFCQVADTTPGRPFWAAFRCCCCEVLVCSVRFPWVFEHLFSASVFRSSFFADFAHVAILFFSGPKLMVLLFVGALYAARAVLTAFLHVLRRYLLLLFLSFR